MLGSAADHATQAKVAHLILAGDSIHTPIITSEESLSFTTRGQRERSDLGAPIRSFDGVAAALAATVPVTVMTGPGDPGNYFLPQQPMVVSLFGTASRYPTYQSATNPVALDVDGVTMLGSSGQPVTDTAKYSSLNDPVDILAASLEWGHLAPTAPDTLASYPFYDRDPFVVTETPHVYFAGGQKAFGTRRIEGDDGQVCRLIAVPDWRETCEIVLLNLATLEAHTVCFKVD